MVLWEDRGVVPFLKVDKGLEAEKDGVQVMRPMPELDALLTRAVKHGVFGTKMRSVINLASKAGIAAIAETHSTANALDKPREFNILEQRRPNCSMAADGVIRFAGDQQILAVRGSNV